jgi:hypothetical protein
MTTNKALEVLIHLNKWRRNNDENKDIEMPNPAQIGIAIDKAIKILTKKVNKKQAGWTELILADKFRYILGNAYAECVDIEYLDSTDEKDLYWHAATDRIVRFIMYNTFNVDVEEEMEQ